MVLRPQLLQAVNSRHLCGVCCHMGRQLLFSRNRHSRKTYRSLNEAGALVSSLSDNDLSRLLVSEDLQQYMKQHDIQASFLSQPCPTPPQQVIKSMVLIIKLAAAARDSSTVSDADSEPQNISPPLSAAAPAGPTPLQQLNPDPAAAVLVLVRGDTKVDLSLVAKYLGISRRSIRLAGREEAAAVTGYEVGSIPPFGHRVPLRTLIDHHILQPEQQQQQQQQQQWLYAGGGSPAQQLQLTSQQLLAATAAEVGNFTQPPASHQLPSASDSSRSSSNGSGSITYHQQQQRQQQQQQGQGVSSAWLDQLPVPWPADSEYVELVGVIAQKRRMAKLLLFCSLVPEAVPPLPADGTAAYVRRLWRHPQQDTTAEVQLILGKTIERNLGRAAAAALFDHIKVGAVVSVRGRVQQNLAALKQEQQLAHDSSSSSGSGQVLDVVVHELQVLHKNRDTLARAIRAAQRRGHVDVTSAVQLMKLQQQQTTASSADGYTSDDAREDGSDSSSEMANPALVSNSSRNSSSRSSIKQSVVGAANTSSNNRRKGDASQQQQQMPAQGLSSSSVTASTPDGSQHGDTRAAMAASPDQFWVLPIGLGRVHWVSDLHSIQCMRQAVLGQDDGVHTKCTGNSTNSSSSSSDTNANGSSSDSSNVAQSAADGDLISSIESAQRPSGQHLKISRHVIGLDCEWKPYDKGQPASPVALLQLATRTDVFLIDLLAICQQRQQQPEQQASCAQQPSDGQQIEGLPAEGTDGSSSSNGAAQQVLRCTPAESALGNFLLEVLSSEDIIKVGFGLGADLNRLQQSYPHLPCFQPLAGAPTTAAANASHGSPTGASLAQHIDLQALSRVVAPNIHKYSTSLSLSKLVASVLGKPLDKSQQISNWEQRPLSVQQQVYAAGDALVLTVVFDVLWHNWLVAGGDDGLLDRLAASSAVKHLPVVAPSDQAELAVVGAAEAQQLL